MLDPLSASFSGEPIYLEFIYLFMNVLAEKFININQSEPEGGLC